MPDARSTRPDAFNFGSASGERLKGGETIKKIFGRISAMIHLHDAVKVGVLGARGDQGSIELILRIFESHPDDRLRIRCAPGQDRSSSAWRRASKRVRSVIC